jgi:ATP phosphoribosyltransferase regulatory subunit
MRTSNSSSNTRSKGEKITRGHTPKGVGPVFSRVASLRRETTTRLLRLFSLWGYTEITLPAFEYLDSLAPGLDPVLQHKAYTLQDRGSGHVLLLRPDATAQIARLVAQGQEDSSNVQRYAYSTTVFRHEDHHILERELLQTGVELFGLPGGYADWEILELCLEGVRILNLALPVLSVSHAGLQKSLIQFVGQNLSSNSMENLKRYFYAHDSAAMKEIIGQSKNLSRSLANALDMMLGRTYPVQDALRLLKVDPVFRLSSDIEREAGALSEILLLASTGNLMDRIRVDFALNPAGPYYSGMVFHLYVDGTSQELASGGRYDTLPALFGKNIPATGFAYHLNRIETLLGYENESPQHDFLEVQLFPAEDGARKKLIACANELREHGVRVSYRIDSITVENEKRAHPLLFWTGNDFILALPEGKPVYFQEPDAPGVLSRIRKR